jgi:hypothetical protein
MKKHKSTTYKVDSSCSEEVEKHGDDSKAIRPGDEVILRVHHPILTIRFPSKYADSQEQENS